MTNTGQRKKGIVWKPPARPESTWHFSAVMKYTGKQDGKTVQMVPIRRSGQWFVIKKVRCPHREKMRAEENAILPRNGRDCGGMAAVFPQEMPEAGKCFERGNQLGR